MSTYKETWAYVAAWARTITPPAQRLGLRGESDAMVDRCVSWEKTVLEEMELKRQKVSPDQSGTFGSY